jgi:hypothetical protein
MFTFLPDGGAMIGSSSYDSMSRPAQIVFPLVLRDD